MSTTFCSKNHKNILVYITENSTENFINIDIELLVLCFCVYLIIIDFH